VGKKTVYQTLEDRNNPDDIENHGPYRCKRPGAWLGNGYYFWDTFIDNAHWWGREGGTFANGYIICSAECDYNTNDCYDLVGETDHILDFVQSMELMKTKNLITSETTVARVIKYIKDDIKKFKYTAIRIYGVNSKRKDSPLNKTLLFSYQKPQCLDLRPPIQICFYERNSLNLRDYTIIYPEEYISGYAV
jgi:hypothetical protein